MSWRDLLWPGRNALPAARDSQDQVERWLVDSFRNLSHLCSQLADYVEAQRLARGGYKRPDRFLERTDPGAPPPVPGRPPND
jgi:hypothetical protein